MFRLCALFILFTVCSLSPAKDKKEEEASKHSAEKKREQKTGAPKARPVADAPTTATSATEPSASAEMGYIYPFEPSDETSTPVMITRTEINGDDLTISVTEGEDYQRRSMSFKFPGVVDGTDPRYEDSDSTQVAVLWKDKDGKIIGRSTNATPQGSRLFGKKNASQWEIDPVAKPTKLAWKTKIPNGATQFEVVSIFTDTLMSPPSQTSRSNAGTARSGDLPLVMSSFSGKKGPENIWAITPMSKNVEAARGFPQGQYPKVGQLSEHVEVVRKFLRDQTQYSLIRRPQSLEGILSPVNKPSKQISDMIDKAISSRQIQGINDTGFDIDPNSPLE